MLSSTHNLNRLNYCSVTKLDQDFFRIVLKNFMKYHLANSYFDVVTLLRKIYINGSYVYK